MSHNNEMILWRIMLMGVLPLIIYLACYFVIRKKKNGTRIFLLVAGAHACFVIARKAKVKTITTGNFDMGPVMDWLVLLYGGLLVLLLFSVCYRVFGKNPNEQTSNNSASDQ